jgi:hypothetical protein
MNAIRNATLAAAALFGLGLAHAGEITEFPIAEKSTVSRADVKAAAEAANRAGALRHDFIGPAQQPMSMKSREEVRHEAVQRRSTNVASASPIVGGM